MWQKWNNFRKKLSWTKNILYFTYRKVNIFQFFVNKKFKVKSIQQTSFVFFDHTLISLRIYMLDGFETRKKLNRYFVICSFRGAWPAASRERDLRKTRDMIFQKIHWLKNVRPAAAFTKKLHPCILSEYRKLKGILPILTGHTIHLCWQSHNYNFDPDNIAIFTIYYVFYFFGWER